MQPHVFHHGKSRRLVYCRRGATFAGHQAFRAAPAHSHFYRFPEYGGSGKRYTPLNFWPDIGSNNFWYIKTVLRNMFNHYCKILVLAACVFAASQSVACSRPVASTSANAGNTGVRENGEKGVEEEILFYVNKFRRTKGLKPLELSNVISIEARDHSKSMATGRRGFGHSGFESRVDDISKKLGTVRAA